MICEGSNTKSYVSDYNAVLKKARCNSCGKVVKVTFPNKELPNLAKFPRHSRKEIK